MKQLTSFARCLSDENRLKILRLLAEKDLCVFELVEILGAPQARVSQHLQRLRKEGIVSTTRDGQWVVYSLDRKELKRGLKRMKKFFAMDPGESGLMKEEFEKLEALDAQGLAVKRPGTGD